MRYCQSRREVRRHRITGTRYPHLVSLRYLRSPASITSDGATRQRRHAFFPTVQAQPCDKQDTWSTESTTGQTSKYEPKSKHGTDPLTTPSTSPPLETPNPELEHTTQSVKATTNPPGSQDQRYIKLDPKYTRTMTWSNNPRDLDLYGAFHEEEPNLSSDFSVKGLRPIVKNEEDDQYILQDAAGSYYLWDQWDGHLLRVTEKWTEGLEKVEDAVDNILCNLYWVQEDAVKVFRTYD